MIAPRLGSDETGPLLMVVQRACSTRAVVDPGLFYGFYGNPLLREYLSAIKYVYVHVQTDAHTNVHVTLS